MTKVKTGFLLRHKKNCGGDKNVELRLHVSAIGLFQGVTKIEMCIFCQCLQFLSSLLFIAALPCRRNLISGNYQWKKGKGR